MAYGSRTTKRIIKNDKIIITATKINFRTVRPPRTGVASSVRRWCCRTRGRPRVDKILWSWSTGINQKVYALQSRANRKKATMTVTTNVNTFFLLFYYRSCMINQRCTFYYTQQLTPEYEEHALRMLSIPPVPFRAFLSHLLCPLLLLDHILYVS